MIKTLAAAAISAPFLLCGSTLAFAQTSMNHASPGTMSSSTSTTPGTSSMSNTAAAGSASQLSGPITGESQLRKELEAKGYSDVSNITHTGNYYTASAKQGNQTVKLKVDASNGMVTKQSG